MGDLRRTVPFHAPCEDLPDNSGRFIVNDPVGFRGLRILHVAIGRIGGQILTGFTLLLHGCLDLFAAVLHIELVDNVQERR